MTGWDGLVIGLEIAVGLAVLWWGWRRSRG